MQGPHPETGKTVFHWYELCDAVQAESYQIDEIAVSNFVLPLYFSSTEERAGRNDFLGRRGKNGKVLESFSVNEGGYRLFNLTQAGTHLREKGEWRRSSARRLKRDSTRRVGRAVIREPVRRWIFDGCEGVPEDSLLTPSSPDVKGESLPRAGSRQNIATVLEKLQDRNIGRMLSAGEAPVSSNPRFRARAIQDRTHAGNAAAPGTAAPTRCRPIPCRSQVHRHHSPYRR